MKKYYIPCDPDVDLWRSIHDTQKLTEKARQKELNRFGISTAQAAVLDYLINSGGNATAYQISRWILRTPQSVSGILNRMVKDGTVIKTRDSERRNVVRVVTTEKGEQAYQKLSSNRKSIHTIIGCLTTEERKYLEICLRKIKSAARKRLRE